VFVVVNDRIRRFYGMAIHGINGARNRKFLADSCFVDVPTPEYLSRPVFIINRWVY